MLDRAPAVFIPGIGSELSPPPPPWLAKEAHTFFTTPQLRTSTGTETISSGTSVRANPVRIVTYRSIGPKKSGPAFQPTAKPTLTSHN